MVEATTDAAAAVEASSTVAAIPAVTQIKTAKMQQI